MNKNEESRYNLDHYAGSTPELSISLPTRISKKMTKPILKKKNSTS